MEKLIIFFLITVFISAQAFHVKGGNEGGPAGYTIIPFGFQDVWPQIEATEDTHLISEFQDLLVKLIEANESKIEHAKNLILEPLKLHLEKSPEHKLALLAQSVQALTILLLSNDINKYDSCSRCCFNCCNGHTKRLF